VFINTSVHQLCSLIHLCISCVHGFLLQHALLETEAENVRSSILSAVQHVRSFGEEVNESARRLYAVIRQIEGSVQVVSASDGSATAEMVSVS
jgi:hypothetical protein